MILENHKIRKLLEQSEKSPETLTDKFLDPEEQTLSLQLHYRLENCTTGKARTLIMRADQTNGRESWRLLHVHYEPGQTTQTLVLMNKALNPEFDDKDVLNSFYRWEQKLEDLTQVTTRR